MSDAPIQPFPIRDRLTPFLTRTLLTGTADAVLKKAPALPRSRANLYAPEDLSELGTVFSQGVLHAMVHRARGWERRPVLIGSRASASRMTTGRLWDVATGDCLRFSDGALELAEHVYTACRPQREKPDTQAYTRAVAALSEGTWTYPGDQLLAYWLVDPAWMHLTTGKRLDQLRRLLRRQPMLGLRLGPWVQAPPDPAALDALINGPTRTWLPWWIAHALRLWRTWEERIWRRDLRLHIDRRQTQAAWFGAWLDAIERSGFHDLLPPFMDHLRFMLGSLEALAAGIDPSDSASMHREHNGRTATPDELAEAAIDRVRHVFRRERESDRMRAREAWAEVLSCGARIQASLQTVRAIHPIDRDPNHEFLVELFGSDLGLCDPKPRRGETGVVVTAVRRLDEAGRTIGGRLG